MVLTSGWQLMVACRIRAASSTTVTRRSVSFMAASGVTAPGSIPSVARISSAESEREPPAGADEPMQRFELDHRVLERGDQEQRSLLVLEEQVLGMAAGNRPAQRLRLLDGEQRGVRHGRMCDAEPVESGEEVVGVAAMVVGMIVAKSLGCRPRPVPHRVCAMGAPSAGTQ
jgi:hypothetical protein